MPSLPRYALFRVWLPIATIAAGLAMPPLVAAGGQDAQQNESEPTRDLLWRAVTGDEAVEKKTGEPRERMFSLLGLQVGADDDGSVTFGGAGRFFSYLNNRTAVQAEGTADFFTDRREGQFDIGLVQRIQNAQVGLFSNFKYARLDWFDQGGLLAQATATFDYLFPRGRLGIFGTKGLRDQVLVHRREVRRHRFEEDLLQIVDQLGLSAQIDIVGDSYVEGNAAYLYSAGEGGRGGGTVRLVLPLVAANPNWAVRIEGGWNETLLTNEGSGRFLVGVQLGRPVRPSRVVGSPLPVPVDIPRIRYEVTTRERRVGNDEPVADAGPDQIDVQTGCGTTETCTITIQLDGSGSFDPDGDDLTYLWEPRSGFDDGASFNPSPNAQAVSFIGEEGKRYVVRLTVRDQERSGFDDVTITIAERPSWPPPKIVWFRANPSTIVAGGWSELSWSVRHATQVTLDQGPVEATGTRIVDNVWDTTVYTLTATNEHGEVATRSVTLNVVPDP